MADDDGSRRKKGRVEGVSEWVSRGVKRARLYGKRTLDMGPRMEIVDERASTNRPINPALTAPPCFEPIHGPVQRLPVI